MINIISLFSFLVGLSIGLIFHEKLNRLFKKIFKELKNKKSKLDINQEEINMLLDELIPQIIYLAKEINMIKSGVLDKDHKSSVKIHHIVNDIKDKLSEEDVSIIEENMRKGFLDDYIYNVIDSNYDDIAQDSIIEEDNIKISQRKNKIKPNKSQDITNSLMNFYSEGQDI